MKRHKDWQQHRSPSEPRNRAIHPVYGAGLELRALLPELTAGITATRPCRKCGRATPTKRAVLCAQCKTR